MSLSQQMFANLREAYVNVYAPKFETVLDELTDQEVDELTEEIIEEVVEEFFLECLEEGLDIGSVEETLCESLESSITALNESVLMEMNPYAPAGSKESQAYNKASTASKRSAESAAKRKEVIGKVKGAVKKVGSALKSGAKAAYKSASAGAGAAVGAVKRAASTAKSEFKKGYERGSKSSSSDSEDSDSGSSASSSTSSSSGSSSSGRTRKAVGGALRSVGRLLKKGLKKAVGGTARAVSKGADKVATRLGEETQQVDVFDFVQEFLCVEGYADDLDHAEWMMANIINEEAIEIILNLEDLDEGVKEIADRVVAAAKAGSARHTAAMKGAADAKKRHDASVQKLGSALKPAADTAKSAASGAAKVAKGVGGAIKKGVELERKGAAAVHTLGKKMNAAKKAFTKEDLDAWIEEAYRSAEENNKRYDRARKRAAQRAAERNAARDRGQTGAVPGVGYVTPRRERETYTDSAGKTRHAKGL